MTYDRLAAIRSEADAFLAAARHGLDAQVPGCPEWTVGDLTYHLGVVHRNHAAHVVRGVTTEPDFPEVPDPSDDELLGWFDRGVDELIDTLRSVDPELPAWNWAPHTPQVASWWQRRMALETAVHRWDAQSAHGLEQPIELAVAVDGIEEMLRIIGPSHTKPDFPTGVIAVRADEGMQWAARLAPDSFEVLAAVPAASDAAVEGTASALLLAMWGRQVPFTATGDPALIAALT